MHSRNTGMAFGLFGGSDAQMVLRFCCRWCPAAWCCCLPGFSSPDAWTPRLAGAGLALLAGGAAGNLLDRLIHGAVTDFVELHAGSFYWPAFNLADSAITVGAALLVIELFRGDSRRAVAQE